MRDPSRYKAKSLFLTIITYLFDFSFTFFLSLNPKLFKFQNLYNTWVLLFFLRFFPMIWLFCSSFWSFWWSLWQPLIFWHPSLFLASSLWPVLCLKKYSSIIFLQIYVSRDFSRAFSSYATQNLRKKILSLFLEIFLGWLHKKNC